MQIVSGRIRQKKPPLELQMTVPTNHSGRWPYHIVKVDEKPKSKSKDLICNERSDADQAKQSF